MNQLQMLRKKTGEERLKLALELSELTRELSIANIKEQLGKKASKKQIMTQLLKRLRKT